MGQKCPLVLIPPDDDVNHRDPVGGEIFGAALTVMWRKLHNTAMYKLSNEYFSDCVNQKLSIIIPVKFLVVQLCKCA